MRQSSQLDFRKVPIIVVFTQFDKLVNQIEFKMNKNELKRRTPEEARAYIEATADRSFEEICTHPLARLNNKIHWAKVSSTSL